MRYLLFLFVTFALVIGAYQTAKVKINHHLDADSIQLGMSFSQIAKRFGRPSARSHNNITFILDDGSELLITLNSDRVSSARVNFKRPIKINLPDIQKLTPVKPQTDLVEARDTEWIFAAKPDKGLIYKISPEGFIKSLTWTAPFSAARNSQRRFEQF